MENKERLEVKIYREMANYFKMHMISDPAQYSALIYEICYLRLLGLGTFKNIAAHGHISFNEFIELYYESLNNGIKNEIEFNKKNELEVSFKDSEYCIDLAKQVLTNLNKYKSSVNDFFPIISIMCSYSGTVIRNIMSIDLNNTSRNEYQTPDQYCKIINYILDIDKNDDVLDIGSSYGNYLVNVNNCCDYKKLNGIEINMELALISKIRLVCLTGSFDIINEDIFKLPFNNKYDKILCNFPWGIHYKKYELDYVLQRVKDMRFNWDKISPSSFDWIFIDVLLTLMRDTGKAAAIMSSGSLFKVIDASYRKDLVNNGLIEAVIKLPLLFNSFGFEQNLVVFSSNNKTIKFVDLSNQLDSSKFGKNNINMNSVFEILNSENNRYISTVPVESIANNDYLLTVNNYVGKKEISFHNPRKLSDFVIDVFRGYQMSSREQEELKDENGNYEILTISDIDNGKISPELTRISSEEKRYDRYLLKNNDLIISSKGTRIKIAVVDEIFDRKIIANGNLIVLRLDTNKINPYYLEMYLNSEDGQTILHQIQTGSVIISINPSRLIDITISTLTIEEQNKIAEKYKIKKVQLEMAKEHLKKLEEEQLNFFDNEVMEMFN